MPNADLAGLDDDEGGTQDQQPANGAEDQGHDPKQSRHRARTGSCRQSGASEHDEERSQQQDAPKTSLPIVAPELWGEVRRYPT
jgi:hypothetical protein